MRTGSVDSPGGVTRTVAPNSPKAKMKATTQAAASPVRICGSTMREKVRSQLAPPTSAASSNEMGDLAQACRQDERPDRHKPREVGNDDDRHAFVDVARQPRSIPEPDESDANHRARHGESDEEREVNQIAPSCARPRPTVTKQNAKRDDERRSNRGKHHAITDCTS